MMKKGIALFLAMLMIASMLPMQLFAIDGPSNEEPTEKQSSFMENQNQASGIVYTKTSTAKSDGSVDIVLTAHTTGEVKQDKIVSPTDIVLVLDVSGSMDENYDAYTINGYNAIDGEHYQYWQSTFLIFGRYVDAYGFDDSDETYYINIGTSEEPKYAGVEYTGRDANGYEIYEYYVGNDTIHVYPKLDTTYSPAREHSYSEVQFYKADISTKSVKKMTDLKEAVNNFIDATLLANEGLEEFGMHTISIVKFASDSYYSNDLLAEGNHKGAGGNSSYNYTELVKGLTPVTEDGAEAIKTAVNGLTPGGATAVDYGLNIAEAVLMNRSQVSGENAVDRNEVIIVFTDGDPNHGSGFSNSVANTAIDTAKDMKTQAGVKIYSVCIASDANSVDDDVDINKFMHYVSSNFPNAASITDAGTDGGKGNGYYMTPSEGMSLSMIFNTILQNIDHPTVELGEEATLVDTLSPYFDFVGGNAANVTLATSTRNADGTWAEPVVVDDGTLDYRIDGDRITVTGFDFDENFVSATGRGENGDFYGKRLVVSFTVIPDYGVIDAAGVSVINGSIPTNTIASLVDSSSAPVAEVETPVLNIHQVTYKVEGEDDKIYERLTGADVTVMAAPVKTGYTFDGWTYPEYPEYPEDLIVNADGVFEMPDWDVTIRGTFTANKYDVTYVYGGTVPSDATALPEKQTAVAYGTEVTVAHAATADGYIFSGWSPLEQDVTISGGKFTMPDHPVTLRGVFYPEDNTTYTVEHYLETMTEGEYVRHEIENKTGVTDTTATAIPKKFTGFTYDEGNVNEVVSGTIAGNDSLVLKLYYTRDEYDVTYAYSGDVPANAPAHPEATAYKYGETVTVTNNVSVLGYTFAGWESISVDAKAGETFTMPAHAVAFVGEFDANDNTAYKVEYYLENLEDSGFSLNEDESYTSYATTGTRVAANRKVIEGFTFDEDNENNLPSGTVTGDGNLTLRLYYTRNTYTVTYAYDGEQPNSKPELPVDETEYKYGATVPVADTLELEGYTFEGWYATNIGIEVNDSFVMPAEDVTLLGTFEPASGTPWVEEHYYMDTNGEYPEEPNYSYDHTGTTGDDAEAVAAIRQGFTFDEGNENNITEAKIAADGSTVLRFYYKRNLYTVTYVYNPANQPNGAPTLPEAESYYFGEEVTVEDTLSLMGYTFNGWLSSIPNLVSNGGFDMPASNVVFRGNFVAAEDTPYTVIHYTEELDGTFEEYDIHTHYGTTGEDATGTELEIPGFSFDEDNDGNITTAEINADGSTVLKYHYVRNKHRVTYAYEGTQPADAPELPTDTTVYMYGETVTVEDDLELEGYIFNGWYTSGHITVTANDATFEMPDREVTLYAKFEPASNTRYGEIHYLENLEGGYEDAEVYFERPHYGTTGETATAARMTPTGFTFDEDADNVESAAIAADGSTVLVFHYKRNKYTVSYVYDPADGQPEGATEKLPTPKDYKYGETVAVEGTPSLIGYTFVGWNPEQSGIPTSGSFTMPSYSVVFEGNFNPNSNTKYTVHHHLEKADGSGYDLPTENIIEHRGTTGAEVTAQPRNFIGYILADDTPVCGTVKADGSLVLDLYYNRIEYTVTYYVTGRVPDGVTAPEDPASPYRHGEEVTLLPTLGAPAGITFVGWTPVAQSEEENMVTIEDGKFIMPMHNVRLEGRFSANSGIPYVIRHWTENVTLDDYEIYTSDRRVGTTGDIATAYGLTIPGFTDVTEYPAGSTEHKLSAEILGDGSLAIDFYYDRNLHNVTYVYDGKTPEDAPELPDGSIDVPFGKQISVADVPAVPGYTFEGWTYGGTTVTGFEMPDEDVELVGKFASNLVKYKVNYWFQNLDAKDTFDEADYTLSDASYEREAYTGEYVQVDNLPRAGFHVNTEHSVGYGNVTVDENGVGNLVLNIYFDRNVYNVTYGYYGEQPTTNVPDVSDKNLENVRFGTTVEIASRPTLSGYTFNGWYTNTANVTDGTFVMPDHHVTLLGFFEKKNTPGGTVTTKYTLTYDSNGGTEYDSEKYEKGTVVKLDKTPEKESYTFAGWFEDEALTKKIEKVTMDKNKTVYAGWNHVTPLDHPVPGDLDGEHHIAYVIGYPNGTVRPLEHITRAEVSVILFRLLKEEVRTANLTEENAYADVEEGSWYNSAISTLTKMGIVHGRTETEFMPDEYITRAEFATFCARFDTTVVEFKDDFSDIDDHWAAAYIHEAAARGWVKGYEDGTFRPDGLITRAEAMALINRVLCRIPENTEDLLDSMYKWPDNADTSAWYYLDVQEATNSHTFEYKEGTEFEKWLKLVKNPDWEEYND